MFKTGIKESLLGMHSLQITHRDVKLDNCLYSPTFKKFVLVDFGISQPIK
jgi:serine/threonine protein kinase